MFGHVEALVALIVLQRIVIWDFIICFEGTTPVQFANILLEVDVSEQQATERDNSYPVYNQLPIDIHQQFRNGVGSVKYASTYMYCCSSWDVPSKK